MSRVKSLVKIKKPKNLNTIFGLPAKLYTDNNFWKKECSTVLSEGWLFVGFVHEFKKPGDVIPLFIADKPILLVKDNNSKINAFHNVCSHRCLKLVDEKVADDYYSSRAYESRIGAWASKQSNILKDRNELLNALEDFKKKYKDKDNVPRPSHWSGWNLKPSSIEFWLDGDNRIHERLKYILDNNSWTKNILSP